MFYIDSQKTLTRRDSSLILSRHYTRPYRDDYDIFTSTRGPSTTHLISDSRVSLVPRHKGSVRKEITTSLFESMLDCIVESWEKIDTKNDLLADMGKISSDLTLSNSKKKKSMAGKQSKVKKSRSKIELNDSKGSQSDFLQLCWWSSPDERVIIKFKNGCTYEGNISKKCMHGEGRYQWADGTVYLGQFKRNEIHGKGTIYWKDDTWYQGDFAGNLRHGRGLYVDSRKQRSYSGNWHYGTKNGQGVIYYTGTFKNSYDGEWVLNERHGYGSREYCKLSGYKGDWNKFIREGKGLMIWPNHDFYRGEWKNGEMSGYGFYIWDAYYNNSMSLPSLCAYRGFWEKGKRNGYGVLNLGLGLGSYYKGEFKNNKKHGVGKFVTNNGLILQNNKLFLDDNIGLLARSEQESDIAIVSYAQLEEPYVFDICNDSVGLIYHVEQVIKNIDRKQEVINRIVNDFFETNKIFLTSRGPKEDTMDDFSRVSFADLVEFEISSLQKSLRCYETDLKNIYYQYATICNKEEIHFPPILIRLYLWQLYYDCNLHNKGLTFVEIDRIFHENPNWLSRKPHNPFEKIYFWQFQHSLISVAGRLYAKRELPGKKPDTMLASAFRQFMEKDVLPGAGRKRGRLVEGYGSFIPLKDLYELFRSLGEPCTIRTFLCAARHPPHYLEQPMIIDQDCVGLGRNAYIFGDEMTFVIDDPVENSETNEKPNLKLFNISNLSSKTIIKIFSSIFPHIYESNKIMDLDVEITFYEYFETIITCIEESILLPKHEIEEKSKMRTKNPMAKKPQQILFSKNIYGPQVKVENWDFQIHVEKKDNYVYRDSLSNHLSTYLRLGTEDQNIGKTETRHMLEQIFNKTDPVYAFKPLVNFTSYPCTDTPGRNKLMKIANLAQLPPDFGIMDYISTQQNDYRNPYATVAKPLTMASPPWLLNRVIRSDLTHNHGTAPPRGDYQCLDTHTPIGHIRQMRQFRYQSFNPSTCLQDFPDCDLSIIKQ